MSSIVCEADKLPSLASTQPCVRFSLIDMQSATADFDDELVIGQGGFGKVYKGCISLEETSHVVAIKRLDSKSNQGAPEFRAEIEMLSRLRHCHLVSLIGYCDDSEEMILVYAYMPHGTLYHHLHKAETPLNWVQRLKIAIGTARGLDYLHTGFGTQHGVIHRDMKSSNILLDENWEAMISDFGMSKIGPTNQSMSYVEASVKGTFGYLDPEYFYTRKLTRKTDVYAFGVVLFELLSGRLAVDERNGEDQCSLVRWAQKCVKERKLDQMVDAKIKGTIFSKCLRGFARIADHCLHSVLKQRPTMAEVVVSLQALLELQQRHDYPAKPSGIIGFTWKIHQYLVSETKQNSEVEKSNNIALSNNNATDVFHDQSDTRSLKHFTYRKLRRATNNFDHRIYDSRDYYKGWINKTAYSPSEDNTGLGIVVKKIDSYNTACQLDLKLLKEFNHPNLEKLIGYCLERELFLVYEYMPNGNFKDLLNTRAVAKLPLVTKVKIAVGIARGIRFLNRTQYKLNVSNSGFARHKIFLDTDFTAKLSGYDVTKLLYRRYPTSFNPHAHIEYAPWLEISELDTDRLGFKVVFTELLTPNTQISDDYEFRNIDHIQHGETSLGSIAELCYKVCDEVDSESKILSILKECIFQPRPWSALKTRCFCDAFLKGRHKHI